MKKIYHLSTCSTCAKIIKGLNIDKTFELQDIKKEKITAMQLDEMKKISTSYENLFSRKSIKYKTLSLKEKILTEKDFRKLILDEYTFLKRPVIIIGKKIFIGNAKNAVDGAKDEISKF